jgi:AraC-like DNA-binding protein
MSSVGFTVVPPPVALADDVECFRIVAHVGRTDLAVHVCPNGRPGIVFQHQESASAVRDVTTPSNRSTDLPTLFLYGQATELGVMRLMVPSTTIQAVLKPYALKTLLGLDASQFTNTVVGAEAFGAQTLGTRLLAAANDTARIALLTDFLLVKHRHGFQRDTLIEESVSLANKHIDIVTVEWLRARAQLSERQFERRFMQMVGITPQLYIRIRRVNEAMRLMDTGQFERLSDVAHALNYHDQSHFIRDMKTFAGITPKRISQKVNDFHYDQVGSSYL